MFGPLRDLQEEIPLPNGWCKPEVFHEIVDIGRTSIALVGLVAHHKRGGSALGSAAGNMEAPPFARAYYELVERACILEAQARGSACYRLHDAAGVAGRELRHDEVFPVADGSRGWQYSVSNGVAAGRGWRDACRRARWELVERDAVLRGWFGEGRLRTVALPDDFDVAGFAGVYSFKAYELAGQGRNPGRVAAVFGFPECDEYPFAYGFGARSRLVEAVAAASQECVQRLGFLWGEEIPTRSPDPEPRPHFHQEYYLCPGNQDAIARWIEGSSPHATIECGGADDTHYVDLTPPELKGEVFVSKALQENAMALTFGVGHPNLVGPVPRELLIHPVA